MKAILLSLLVLTLASSLKATNKLAQIDFLSFGYDIYFGNPHHDGIDPGFKMQPIYDFTYESYKYSEDGRWQYPDQVAITAMRDCRFPDSFQMINDMDDYKKSLQADVSMNTAFPSAAFKASINYKSMEQQITTNNRFYYAQGVCPAYSAEEGYSIEPPLSSAFKRAVKNLPRSYEREAYMQFLSGFGTHAVKRIQMGYKFVFQFSMSEESVNILQSKGISIESQAKRRLLLKYGANAEVAQYNEEEVCEFEKHITSMTEFSVGLPQADNYNVYDWRNQVIEYSIPIKYELMPIYEMIGHALLDDDFSAQEMHEVRESLEKAHNDYCSYLVGLGHLYNCGGYSYNMLGFLSY